MLGEMEGRRSVLAAKFSRRSRVLRICTLQILLEENDHRTAPFLPSETSSQYVNCARHKSA